MLPVMYDDVIPANIENTKAIFSAVKYTYFHWSSRVIISAISLFFLKYQYIWIFLDSFAVAFSAFLISYLFADKNNAEYNAFICLLVAIYPFLDMGTAGFILTSSNYLWPLLFMLVSFVPLKKIHEGKRIGLWEYPVYTISLAIACNTEQAAAIIFIVYLSFILFLLKRNTANLFVTFQFVVIIAELLFIFTAPGNEVRTVTETLMWFNDFDTLSISNKIDLAFSSGVYHFIFKPNGPFLIFFILLFLLVWHKTRDFVPRFVSIIIGLNIFFFAYTREFAKYAVTKYGSADIYVFLFMLLMCAGVLYLISCCFYDKRKKFECFFILFLGLLSRMLMMFSPTIWESRTRTYIFLNFAFLITAFLIYNELKKTSFRYWKSLYTGTIVLASICISVLMIYGSVLPQKSKFFYHLRQIVKVEVFKYDIFDNYYTSGNDRD